LTQTVIAVAFVADAVSAVDFVLGTFSEVASVVLKDHERICELAKVNDFTVITGCYVTDARVANASSVDASTFS
jgi:hypothetical protein